jgi:hypothetical protein
MKTFLLVLCLVAMTASQSFAAVAQDTFAHSTCTNDAACGGTGTTLTYAITVGSGSNRQLGVYVWVTCGGGNPARSVSGVTYAGTTLTQIDSFNPRADLRGYLFDWPTASQPTSGTNNIVVTLSGALVAGACAGTASLLSNALAVTGNHQSTTFSSFNHNSAASGTALSVTISTSNGGDFGFQTGCSGSGLTSTTQTSLYTPEGDANESCGTQGSATATGGTTAFDWTASGSDVWGMMGAAFKDAGGAVTQRAAPPFVFQ